jgi:glucosylglycerol-phosphate synthase
MDSAIERALEMPKDEQIKRMSRMSSAVESFTVSDWVSEQMDTLENHDSDA